MKTVQSLALVFSLLPLWAFATPFSITFKNNTDAVAHLDWADVNPTPIPLKDGEGNAKNLAAHESYVFTSTGPTLTIVVAQYGVPNLFKEAPTCKYQFSADGKAQNQDPSANSACTYDNASRTLTMSWPDVKVDYNAVGLNTLNVVHQFLAGKQFSSVLVPNQIPLTETEKTNFLANPGWQLQFGYDAVRFPLWTAAYCQQAAHQNKPFCTALNQPSGKQPAYFKAMAEFINTHKCTTKNGTVGLNPDGYWALHVNGFTDGSGTASACDITPAFLGPMAVLAKAVGDQTLADELIKSLSQYDVSKVTPTTAAGEGNYTSTSAPYFNGSLLLLTQALLVGNGNLDLDSAPEGAGFVSKSAFMKNYQAWKNSGFLANFTTTDKNKKTHEAKRVIFSVVQAPNSDGGNVGKSPTVSEGMGYGLLAAFAANDQVTFNALLHFVLFTAQTSGCAGVADPSGTTCNVKSSWLMPWMVDQAGNPFHYTVGGGYMTNGSATDAEIQIAWALSMAQHRVDAGKWEHTTFAGPDGRQMTYGEILHAMAKDIARYDINQSVDYMGAPVGALYGPGSQWGEGGKSIIFPGYVTPEAFDILGQQ